jgi:hypothetical protein
MHSSTQDYDFWSWKMRRAAWLLVGPGCFLGLLLVFYRPVLFEGGQFAYRDSGSFYYPLYLRVQQEWSAGRWPLWNPGQNGGEPLLGNPMAAVLYPGKVIYALLPYAWAARFYVIVHTAIAFFGLFALAKSCGVSSLGSCLGGLSYAFGAPVFFLYCNVIFLVGAAWVPWGLRAIDRLLRQGRRRGAAELAAVLALQVLGGDPQAAYLTAVCGAGYALVLTARDRERPLPRSTWAWALAAMGIWVLATLGLASARVAMPESRATNGFVLVVWLAVLLGMAWRSYRRPGEARLAPRVARLSSACALGLALAGAQAVPVAEFASQSQRVDRLEPTDINCYSLDPARVVEFIWPNVFGINSPDNRSWLQAIPPVGDHFLWVDSLYIGGLALVLALGATRWKGGPSWCVWLTIIVMVSLAASCGKYGSPLWWARWGSFAAVLGPHDPINGGARVDGFLHDGAGSPYGLLSMLLPGFGAFRYPSKLLVFTAVGLAVLTGVGWDRMTEGGAETRRVSRLAFAGLAASLAGLFLAVLARGRAVTYLMGNVADNPMFGPANIASAWTDTQRALAHGTIVFAAILALARWAPRRRHAAGALALLFLSADLALANAHLTMTVPQATFEAPSEAARLIEAAEHSDPSPGPFRVHRMSTPWIPARFGAAHADQRLRELIVWTRDTIAAPAALPLGLEYCTTTGTVELDDYVALFKPTMIPVPAGMARTLEVPAGSPVVCYPRRSFDLWGARYFLLPGTPDWTSRERGLASFLDKTELIYPNAEILYSRKFKEGREPWCVREDWHLRRNRAVYPRAWLVRSARVVSPASDEKARSRLIRTIVYMNDPVWSDGDRPVLDLRQTALIELDDRDALKGFLSPTPIGASESVKIVQYQPQRVELVARLDRPGLVILADTYYPGWRLTVDGKAAPIYRANRLMRAAAVAAGQHTLVYTYEPASLRAGVFLSAVGLIVLVGLGWSTWRKPMWSHAGQDAFAGTR